MNIGFAGGTAVTFEEGLAVSGVIDDTPLALRGTIDTRPLAVTGKIE